MWKLPLLLPAEMIFPVDLVSFGERRIENTAAVARD